MLLARTGQRLGKRWGTGAAASTTHECLTRLGPSERVPGATGVFCTRPIKKYTPLEIEPQHASSAAGHSSSVEAPPFLCDLVGAPRKSISLRRFLALRAQFSTGQYLHIATERGWYLLAPASAIALPDPMGLKEWKDKHHYRYMRPVSTTAAPGQQSTKQRADEVRRKKAMDMAEWGSLLERGELSKEDLDLVAREIAEQNQKDLEGSDQEGNEEDDDEEVEEAAEDNEEDQGGEVENVSSAVAYELKCQPLCIPEAHLFEINDGVRWMLPPADDLADPAYWKEHRDRMKLYSSSVDTDERDDFMEKALLAVRTPPPEAQGGVAQPTPSEQEVYAESEKIFQALTQKANVSVNVDDDTGLVTLTPLVDLREGDEMLLHYGREWWSERLLSTLFLAVEDGQMQSIRWIEGLFGEPNDVSEPFPQIIVACKEKKKKRSSQEIDSSGKDSSSSAPRKMALYNTATRKEATDAAALVYAVRQSCVDTSFFQFLLNGNSTSGPIFHINKCDVEVPLSQLREALMQSMLGYKPTGATPKAATENGEDDVFSV